jgi:hypothetical protein
VGDHALERERQIADAACPVTRRTLGECQWHDHFVLVAWTDPLLVHELVRDGPAVRDHGQHSLVFGKRLQATRKFNDDL